MGAPKEILGLVNRFREQFNNYLLPSYGLTDGEIRIVEEATAR